MFVRNTLTQHLITGLLCFSRTLKGKIAKQYPEAFSSEFSFWSSFCDHSLLSRISVSKISLFFWQMSMSHPSWRRTTRSLTQFPPVLPPQLQQPPRSRAQSPVTQVLMWSHLLWADALKISLRSRQTRPPLMCYRQPSYGTRVLILCLQNRASSLWMDFEP